MNGEQFDLGKELGELKADVRACLSGILELSQVKEKVTIHETKISILQWVAGTTCVAVIGVIVKAIFEMILK